MHGYAVHGVPQFRPLASIMKYFYTIIFGFLAIFSIIGSESIIIPESTSPNGKYVFRRLNDDHRSQSENLQLIDPSTKVVKTSIENDGYCVFPYNTQKEYLTIIWSPDSKHVAVTYRDTKRSWETLIYALKNEKLIEIKTQDLTRYVFDQIKAKDEFRWTRHEAVRWINNDSLILHLEGDAIFADEKTPVSTYNTDVIFSVSSKTIRVFTPISTKPEDG